MRRVLLTLLTVAFVVSVSACGKKPPATGPTSTSPNPFPGAVSQPAGSTTPTVVPPPPVPPDPNIKSGTDITSATAADLTLDEINRNSPLKPAFFSLDSDTLDDLARKALAENATVLKTNARWMITVEGHCDERGTAEYNLALADRRALAAKNYLLSLGIAADRLKTVSYGKEFPFDAGHDEDSWSQNRRAHFTVTAK